MEPWQASGLIVVGAIQREPISGAEARGRARPILGRQDDGRRIRGHFLCIALERLVPFARFPEAPA
jgi:hypothetical protein